MSAEDFTAGVQSVLQDSLNMSGAHNSRIFLLDHKTKSFHIYCEAENALGIRRENRALSYSLIQTWARCVGDSSAFLLTSEQDIDDVGRISPEWAKNLREFDVKSLVLLPLRRGKEIFGYVDFINFDTRKASDVQELAELITVYLAAEISNHELMQKLEEMSTSDPLTGLRNRAAMLQKMEMVKNTSFGVINLDLNGLKRVNDTQGHDAGDRLLVMAGEALRKVFYYNDIYRTGGDEFIVFIPGISRDSFARKVDRFRKAMTKNTEVRFAMGTAWSDGTVSQADTFRLADDAMYADKKEFYRNNPELRRK